MSDSVEPDEKNHSKENYNEEILISMYNQHRQEIRAHGKRKSRRYLGSFTVVGVIIGYVFTTSGDGRILVLVPYVLGFLYLSHISSMYYVVQLAALVALIEAKLNHLGAEYEIFHGGFSIHHNPRFDGVQWRGKNIEDLHQRMPKYIRHSMRGVAFFAYITPVAIGAYLLHTIDSSGESPLSASPIGSEMSIIIIIVSTQLALLTAIVISWWNYRNYKNLLIKAVSEKVEEDEIAIKPMEKLDSTTDNTQ